MSGGGAPKAGGGATATAEGSRWHPAPNAIAALSKITCGSARSPGPGLPITGVTLAGSAAGSIIKLLRQFTQPVGGGVERLRGILPQLRHHLIVEIGDYFFQFFLDPRHRLVEALVHLFPEIFKATGTFVIESLVYDNSDYVVDLNHIREPCFAPGGNVLDSGVGRLADTQVE